MTNIDNDQTEYKYFSLDFKNSYNGSRAWECSFRKYDETPLLVVCFVVRREGIHWLQEITQEIIKDDLNIKYRFRFQPVKIEDKIEVKKYIVVLFTISILRN